MFRPGQIIQRPDGETVCIVGRNGCDRSVWWGWPLVNGKLRRDRMRTVKEGSAVAALTENGFQFVMM